MRMGVHHAGFQSWRSARDGPSRNLVGNGLSRLGRDKVSVPNQVGKGPASQAAALVDDGGQPRGKVEENVDLLLSQGLEASTGNFGKQNDRDPLRRFSYSPSGNQAQIDAAGKHEYGDEDGAENGFEAEAVLETLLEAFRRRGFIAKRVGLGHGEA
jgi:hypothetical protein